MSNRWTTKQSFYSQIFFQSLHITLKKCRKKGSNEKEAVTSPNVVRQYNSNMGGVDLIDQKKVTYQFDHRSKSKYYFRIVHDFRDIANNNSYVVYCKLGESVPSMGAKTYRRAVA